MDKATKLIKETYFLIRFYLTISDKTVEMFLKKILLMIIFLFLMGQYSVFGQITAFNVALPNPCTNQLNTSEVSIPNNIIIYPNPTRGIMNIQLMGVNTTEEIEIKIFDSYGNLVFSKNKFKWTDKHLILNLSHLISGVYLLSVTRKNGVMTKKIIISK